MNSILLDLGGTHLRLALLENFSIKNVEVFDSPKSSEDLISCIENYLKSITSPHEILLSIAGPIEESGGDKIVKLTNIGFAISQKEIEKRFGLKARIINDLYALALSISSLPQNFLKTLMPGVSQGRIGIVSCGTGLGVSFLGQDGVSIPSEGGHMEFAPVKEIEWELFRFLKGKFVHVSYERVLSGNSQKECAEFFQKTKTDPDLLWCEILGRFASSIALTALCDGGIYLAGGYLKSKMDLLVKNKETFKTSFLDKGRLSHVLKMQVSIIDHNNPELIGLGQLAKM